MGDVPTKTVREYYAMDWKGRAAYRAASGGAVTESMVMRSRSGTVRRVEAQHALDKLERFSGREYR